MEDQIVDAAINLSVTDHLGSSMDNVNSVQEPPKQYPISILRNKNASGTTFPSDQEIGQEAYKDVDQSKASTVFDHQ